MCMANWWAEPESTHITQADWWVENSCTWWVSTGYPRDCNDSSERFVEMSKHSKISTFHFLFPSWPKPCLLWLFPAINTLNWDVGCFRTFLHLQRTQSRSHNHQQQRRQQHQPRQLQWNPQLLCLVQKKEDSVRKNEGWENSDVGGTVIVGDHGKEIDQDLKDKKSIAAICECIDKRIDTDKTIS